MPSPYVFRALRAGTGKRDGEDRPLTAHSVFQIVLAAAGRVVPGKRITPQGLRKTFIELALAEGEPLEAIINATLRGWGAGYKRASIK